MSGAAAALVSLIGAGFWLCAALRADLLVLVRAPLEAASGGRSDEAFRQADAALRGLGTSLAWALLSVLVGVALVCLAVQGPAFGSPWRAARTDVVRRAPGRTAGLLWGLVLCGCAALTVHESLEAPLSDVPQLARTCTERVLALTLPCMVIDAAFARARFHASLWLTRRALRDEQRAAHGAPEIRAARARLRGEVVS